jgi:hypothetical protein
MAAPSAASGPLALFGALCAARCAFALGAPCSGALRCSHTTSRTSRALSRGRRRLCCRRVAFAALFAGRFELAPSSWLAGCRAPLGRAADRGDCLAAATRRLADTCGPPRAHSSLACCWAVSPPVCSRLTPRLALCRFAGPACCQLTIAPVRRQGGGRLWCRAERRRCPTQCRPGLVQYSISHSWPLQKDEKRVERQFHMLFERGCTEGPAGESHACLVIVHTRYYCALRELICTMPTR